MLGGVSLIVQTTFRDGLSFDPFSLGQYWLAASKVDVGRCQVFQAFMVSLMIVVIDERLDLFFQSARDAGGEADKLVDHHGHSNIERMSS